MLNHAKTIQKLCGISLSFNFLLKEKLKHINNQLDILNLKIETDFQTSEFEEQHWYFCEIDKKLETSSHYDNLKTIHHLRMYGSNNNNIFIGLIYEFKSKLVFISNYGDIVIEHPYNPHLTDFIDSFLEQFYEKHYNLIKTLL